MTTMDDYPQEYHTALKLLTPLWRGIHGDYKRKYARNIWQQFEDNIKTAAYTSKVTRFVNSICSRLQIQIAARDVEMMNEALAEADDRLLLRQLRDEATTLVLMVRLENDKRKDEWKKLYGLEEFE